MTMASAMKFLFQNSFDAADRPASPGGASKASSARARTEQDVLAARQEGYTDGETAGRAAALASIEQASAKALAAISAQLSDSNQQIEVIRAQIVADALKVVNTAIHKVIPDLARHNALNEIERLIGECLQAIYDEPRVVVRGHDRVIAALQPRIDTMAASCGFQGKIVLFGDEQLDENDCRIEWADGGAERILDDIWKQIDAALESMTGGGASPPHASASNKLSTAI